jgi:isoquinoline 1-oxidoreductase beta subunit
MLSKKKSASFYEVDRREFIGGTVATFFVPVTLALTTTSASAATTNIGAYIKVDDSNNVTLITGQTEMGQGITTGLAQLMAEELMLNWSQVRFEHAPVLPATYGLPGWGLQLTGGSTSMMMWYKPLREAAAKAAYRFKGAAAAKFGGSAADWSLAVGGNVTHTTYGTKAFKDLLTHVGGIADPVSVTLIGTKRIVGKTMPRLDLPSKVNGSAKFGFDVNVPNMVFASVIHCPTLTGTVKTAPTSATGALKVVNLGDSVGVIAVNTYAAMKIANSLASQITWNYPANLPALDSTALEAAAQNLQTSNAPANLQTFEQVGSPDANLGTLDATYTTPFLAHACMEVMNCTASVTMSGANVSKVEVWAPTQGQSFIPAAIRSITGMSALTNAQIVVNSMLCGGGFGRKIEQDYIIQAVKLAKAMGKPVKLTWSRPQDFKNDKYRPYASMRVRAGADTNGINGFIFRNISASINTQRANNPEDRGAAAGATGLPYALPNKRIEFAPLPTAIPLGYWRSVGESYNTFAVESAIDEIAVSLREDPIAYRLKLLTGNTRATNLLQTMQNSVNYQNMNSARRGVAFLQGFNSLVALAVEINLDAQSQIKVTKAHYVVDCGVAINPNSIEAQMQGGLVHGIYSSEICERCAKCQQFLKLSRTRCIANADSNC